MNELPNPLQRRHLRFGWYSLLVFLSFGAALELLHGFKVSYYLAVDHETRRLMWRLAHAHGALFALVNVAFALSVCHVQDTRAADLRLASACFIVGALLVPLGFFVGGVFAQAGDPGLFVLLVPLGALLLFYAILKTARSL
jgi:hypothetical protein